MPGPTHVYQHLATDHRVCVCGEMPVCRDAPQSEVPGGDPQDARCQHLLLPIHLRHVHSRLYLQDFGVEA